MEAKKLATRPSLPFELSLRIRHPSIDPAAVSRELGIEARHSFRAGTPRHTREDLTNASFHGESYWLGSLDPVSLHEDTPFSGFAKVEIVQRQFAKAMQDNVGSVLYWSTMRFLRGHAGLFERIRAEGGQVSLLVALAPDALDGFSLAPEVSRTLGDLGITLEFEMAAD
jgi:hypothetical protein